MKIVRIKTTDIENIIMEISLICPKSHIGWKIQQHWLSPPIPMAGQIKMFFKLSQNTRRIFTKLFEELASQ